MSWICLWRKRESSRVSCVDLFCFRFWMIVYTCFVSESGWLCTSVVGESGWLCMHVCFLIHIISDFRWPCVYNVLYLIFYDCLHMCCFRFWMTAYTCVPDSDDYTCCFRSWMTTYTWGCFPSVCCQKACTTTHLTMMMTRMINDSNSVPISSFSFLPGSRDDDWWHCHLHSLCILIPTWSLWSSQSLHSHSYPVAVMMTMMVTSSLSLHYHSFLMAMMMMDDGKIMAVTSFLLIAA